MRLLPLPTQTIATPAGTVEYASAGAGAPAIVLVNGAGGPLLGWGAVFHALAADATVFAYNRPGVGRSAPPTAPQDGRAVVAALRVVLAAAAVPPPYLLVGHSLGGLHVNLFARLHPGETAGVVFLEASHPRDVDLDAHLPGAVRRLNRWSRGLDRLTAAGRLKEVHFVGETAAQIDQAPAFPDVPIAVVSGGRKPALMPAAMHEARTTHQLALAALGPRAERRVAAASGHFPQLTEPEVVIAAVRACLARAR